MIDLARFKISFLTFALATFTIGSLYAQPQPQDLAQQLIALNNERLQHIEQIELVVESEFFGTAQNSSSLLIKVTDGGYSWLEIMDDDADSDLLSGIFDEHLPTLIKGASTVEMDVVEGFSVYHVLIDDADFLSSLEMGDSDYDEYYAEDLRISIWIDSDEFILRKAEFEQIDEDDRMIVTEVLFNNYEYFDGLPIATEISFSISGMVADFSDAYLEEIESSMNQMEAMLDEMPEAQRRVIQEQIEKQKVEFEKMKNNDWANEFQIIVSDVRVNP